MKFLVSRTSNPRVEVEPDYPCEGAERTELWYGQGFNTTDWVVELSDLEALLGFVEKHGYTIVAETSVFKTEGGEKIKHSLEIYDDYRE